MPRVTGHNAITVGIVSIISIYMGVNFFQPIVVERLRKDGNLRHDKDIPHFNEDGSLRSEELPWNSASTITEPVKVESTSPTQNSNEDPFE